MPKLAALQIAAFYILFVILLTPTAAVLKRGIAYVDNYDGSVAAGLKARGVEAEDFEWHKRANGDELIQARAEKVTEAAAAVEKRDQHAADGHFSGEEHNDGTDWNKRGDMHATSEGPDDGHDWLRRAPQWLNKLLRRDIIWNGPEEIGPGPTKVKAREDIDGKVPSEGDGPNDSHDWLMKRGVWPPRGWSPKLDKRGSEWNAPKPEGPDDSHDWLKREEAVSKPNDSHDWLMKRSSIGPFLKSKPFPASGRKLKLDKRGMIEEWMHPRAMEKRQLTCRNPGHVVCSNRAFCCPSQSNCCPSGCKNDPSDVCCNGYSCNAGYQCSQLCGGCVIAGGGCCPDNRNTCSAGERCCPDGCVPQGSICCSGGGYCPAGQKCCGDGCAPEGSQCCGTGYCREGNICVVDTRTGARGCCTDLSCRVRDSGGVPVPSASTVDPEPQPAPETTQPPQTTQPPVTSDVVVYYTYRFTITWWYWYYYYTYWAVQQVSTVTSSQETTITTVTITDTATETSSLFESISSSVVAEFTTPADATTALATPTLPASTAPDASTDDATTSSATITEETSTDQQPEATDEATTTTTRRGTSTTSSAVFTGGSGSSGMVKVNWWLGYVMMGFATGAGIGMVWL